MFEFQNGEVVGNAQRFATELEAHCSAAARFMVWTQPTGYHTLETDDPVNYKRIDGGDEMI
jgi:hypothetical protein